MLRKLRSVTKKIVKNKFNFSLYVVVFLYDYFLQGIFLLYEKEYKVTFLFFIHHTNALSLSHTRKL